MGAGGDGDDGGDCGGEGRDPDTVCSVVASFFLLPFTLALGREKTVDGPNEGVVGDGVFARRRLRILV